MSFDPIFSLVMMYQLENLKEKSPTATNEKDVD